MQTLDLTLASPAENLALDQALLSAAEEGVGGEVLRFWMSPTPFVVVGLGAKVGQEVNLDKCATRQIPVLRRCSGGGTVVQGPGCLNYGLILQIAGKASLESIHSTNRWIMARNAAALSRALGQNVSVQGHTDLAIEGSKVSGNAQRRLRTCLLFHGTFLLDFDLSLIVELLPLPALQPEYRRQRSHADFLRNLNTPASTVKRALTQEWGAKHAPGRVPDQRVSRLVQQRYSRPEWNFRS